MPSDPSPSYLRTTCDPLVVEFLGHPSIESYDLEAGFTGAALEYAQRWHLHRETILRFDKLFTPWLTEYTGIPREISAARTARRQKDSKNPNKISPVYETFSDYIKRVFEQTTPEQQARIKDEALAQSRTLRVCVAPAERISPIEPMFFKRADSILEAGLNTINERVLKWLDKVPDFELARDANEKPIRESLARLLQKYEAAKFAEED